MTELRRGGWAPHAPSSLTWHYYITVQGKTAVALCGLTSSLSWVGWRELQVKRQAQEGDDSVYNCVACKKLLAAERAKAVA